MRTTTLFLTLSLLLSACLGGRSAVPSVEESGVKPEDLSAATWSKLSRPSPSHQLLDLFVGTWNVTLTTKDQSGKPVVSTGTSKSEWILGRRYVREQFKGEVYGEPFEGLSITGYDNGARRYSTVWVDSQSTTMAVSHGKYDEKENLFIFEGEVYDPTLGRNKVTRSQLQVRSSDEYLLTMFVGEAGRQEEFLTISYKRRK